MPYLRNLSLDGSILAFTAALSLLTGIVFGLAPAFQASRHDLIDSLRAGGKSAIVTRQRLRNGLVVTEIALALVLLIGAGLMTKSLLRLLAVDPGFKTENLFMITVVAPAAKYTDAGKLAAFHQQLIARMEALPGAQGAATVGTLPLVGGNTTRFIVEGEPVPPPDQQVESNIRDVSAGYFRTMGIPLISGRHFSDRDNASAPGAVIVNQTLARRVFPNISASEVIGRRIIFSGNNRTPNEIVGVVGDEKVNGLDARTTPVVYYPFLQGPSPFTNLIVRAPNASALAAAIRQEGLALEPELTFFGGSTMERLMENLPATFARRYPTYLIGIFAVIALALAAIGIYGVISYSVSQRAREIGVRVALGARRRDVLTLVIKQGMTLTVAGVAIGLAAAFGLTRLMSNLLFGVGVNDPATYAAIVGLLLAVALVACYLPARKAAKVDPMIALRSE
jgi:putative ABC transport system permease protein